MTEPKVFISYSHDSPDHKAWVLRLASDLRDRGIDVSIDQWDLVLGQDVSMFMQQRIAEADRVLMICSAPYVQKAEVGFGGVGYERLIVTAEIVQSIDTIKFIPILRGNPQGRIPKFLGPRLFSDFGHDAAYTLKLEELAGEIHGVRSLSKPPLGPNPFSGKPGRGLSTRTLGRTAATSVEFLEDEWFAREHKQGEQGIKKLGLAGHMELRVATAQKMLQSQIALLAAVRHSEVRTFGWPIGVILESRDEYRPRSYRDGIRAEISIKNKSRTSYDYWALRSNGDFYLLQSLFEDSRNRTTFSLTHGLCVSPRV
jgi:hypothetical protein